MENQVIDPYSLKSNGNSKLKMERKTERERLKDWTKCCGWLNQYWADTEKMMSLYNSNIRKRNKTVASCYSYKSFSFSSTDNDKEALDHRNSSSVK